MMNNWKLQSRGVPLSHAAAIAGVDAGKLRLQLQNGILGVPPASQAPSEVPLIHLAASIALNDGANVGLTPERLATALPKIAAAAYVRLALTELAERRWEPFGVSAGDCSHLAQRIKLGDGKALIEQQLGLAGADTKRFACFSPDTMTMCDYPVGLYEEPVGGPLVIMDTWGIAVRIKARLPGTLFWGEDGSSSGMLRY